MAACIGRGVGSIVSRSACARSLVDNFKHVTACGTQRIAILGQMISPCQMRFYAKKNSGFPRVSNVTAPLSIPLACYLPGRINLASIQAKPTLLASSALLDPITSTQPLTAAERKQAVMYVRQVLSKDYIDEVITQLLAQLNTLPAHSSEKKGKLSITVADREVAINKAIAEAFTKLPPRSLQACRQLLPMISKGNLDISDFVMVVRCVQNGLIVEGEGVTIIHHAMQSCLKTLFQTANSDEARALIHTTSVSYALDVVSCVANMVRSMKGVIAFVETSYSKPLM